ncbi:hypothetical protein N7513_006247 [Penicillium frequentans]|nr:hypothetical protein N7513_006247 [Penicillium glabrum]
MSDQDPRVVLGLTALLVGVAMLLKEEEKQPTRGQHWIGKDGAKPTKWVAAKKICSCPAPKHAAEKWPVNGAEISITSCANECPYCGYAVRGGGSKGAVIRKHIKKHHIANQADVFGSLTVAAGKGGPSSELQTLCYED